MEIKVRFISFFVIQLNKEEAQGKGCKHYQTLDSNTYPGSSLQMFLDGEFARIVKRKVERNPRSEQVPTKIGHFIVESGYELDTNPNYNLFYRLQQAVTLEQFLDNSEALAQAYMNTSAVRGGALIIVNATLPKVTDIPFVFILKCDFEPKIARITDEASLLHEVEMAINAKNMKSIQYPYLTEEGFLEDWEVKIHQSSHARYFEDFLKFVEYERTMPEIMQDQMMTIVQHHFEEYWQGDESQRQQEEHEFELWAASEKRELQEKWSEEQVMEASQQLIQQKPDLHLQFKLDQLNVKGKLEDFGKNIHFAKLGDRYVVLLEGNDLQFDHHLSPVELLKPDKIEEVLNRVKNRIDNYSVD
ncbi:DUF3900 domain-containing protein [Paenibacillus larvae]